MMTTRALRSTAAALLAGLVLAGCGGDDVAACEGVADDAIGAIQSILDEVGGMSMADLANLEEEPPFLQDLQTDMEELQTRAEEADCSDEEMRDLLAERLDELTAEGEFAEFLLQTFQSQGFGE